MTHIIQKYATYTNREWTKRSVLEFFLKDLHNKFGKDPVLFRLVMADLTVKIKYTRIWT